MRRPSVLRQNDSAALAQGQINSESQKEQTHTKLSGTTCGVLANIPESRAAPPLWEELERPLMKAVNTMDAILGDERESGKAWSVNPKEPFQ